ncbi:MAG: hypothetical protein LBE13_10340 [Bacteroidales bacterium]|jgi:hypothetical protein|nr:hypothetical protein [Bacteroidales bacterium]
MSKLFFMVLLVFFSCKTVAQVTIGSIEKPNRATLLDIKSNTSTHDNATTGVNGGGLQLPRVFLKDKKTFEPFIPITDAEWQNSQTDLKRKHVGLEVYNLSDNDDFKAGIYYWDGSLWQSAEDKNWTIGGNKMNVSEPVLGTLSDNSLSIVSNGNKKIVLGKQEGEIYMKNLPQAPEQGTVPLQINKNGQLFAVVDTPTDYETKPFTYIKFTIFTDNSETGHLDWVNNFNTKINSNKFVMTIIGSAFQYSDKEEGVLMQGTGTADDKGFGTAQIYAFVEDGTWRIRADYAEAHPVNNSKYKWLIYALVINKSMISDEYDIRGEIPKSQTDGEAGEGVDSGYDTPLNLQ